MADAAIAGTGLLAIVESPMLNHTTSVGSRLTFLTRVAKLEMELNRQHRITLYPGSSSLATTMHVCVDHRIQPERLLQHSRELKAIL